MTELDKWQCLRCEEEFECDQGRMPLACPNPNCGKRGPFKALTGPFVFFDSGKFVPKRLADDILRDHHMATHRTSWVIYHYCDGCYRSDGEAAIRELCRERLGALAKESHINEVVKQIRDTTFKPPQDFNPPPNLICLENGVLDINTKELSPHAPDPIFLQKLPVRYDPEAECPTVVKRLLEWTDREGLVKIIQFAGFCLYREYFIRKAIIIHGEGGNGKTTLVLFLVGWLGEDNIAGIKVQNLEKRFMGGRLIGKVANICDDLPSDAWFNTGAFKQLTGGSPIEAEQKFKEGFLMKNYAKALFTANRLPIVSDESNAFWDRITIIPFEAVFSDTVPRENIVGEMLAEGSGFLNLALDGLKMLRAQNEFYGGDDNEATKRKYVKLSDPIMAFAHEKTIESPLSRTPKADVYAAYVEYCTANSFPVKENNVFARSFKRMYPRLDDTQITTEDGKRVRAWVGVNLTSDGGADSPNGPRGGNLRVQAAQGAHVAGDFLLEILQEKYGIQIRYNNVFKPVHPAQPEQENETKEPVQPVHPVQELTDLFKRIRDLLPASPSDLAKHFKDDEMSALHAALEHLSQRGKLILAPDEDGVMCWRLV